MVGTRKTGKIRKKGEKQLLAVGINFENDFFHESAP